MPVGSYPLPIDTLQIVPDILGYRLVKDGKATYQGGTTNTHLLRALGLVDEGGYLKDGVPA